MVWNSSRGFGWVAKVLHWSMALLFVVMFGVAYTMINIGKSAFMFSLYDFHKATGLLLFFLVLVRLVWRSLNVSPQLSNVTWWEGMVAHLNVWVLYAVMFALPIAGFLTSTLGGHVITFYHLFNIAPLAHDAAASELFSKVHEYAAYVLLVAFGMHVMGALFHHYIKKDAVLRGMWFKRLKHRVDALDVLPFN